MLLVGCVVLSFVVAPVFVLTPNAISYEGLLLVPVFILSGIVFTSVDPPAWLALVSGLIPLRLPVDLLLGEPIGAVDALVWCSSFWPGSSCPGSWRFAHSGARPERGRPR